MDKETEQEYFGFLKDKLESDKAIKIKKKLFIDELKKNIGNDLKTKSGITVKPDSIFKKFIKKLKKIFKLI